jgi:hypothetical protein
MLRRIAMTEADAEVLLGMVRKIGWWMEETVEELKVKG